MMKSAKVQPQDEIKAEHHNALVDDVVTLEEKIASIPEGKQGPKGDPGEKGATGPQGSAGKDSEVTKEAFDSLVARVAALEEAKTQ
ncbi:collagen-like protein [Enterococcus faecalis]|nr:collagen-like protein [Enterococcus faecalis]NST15013.1 collagen-like protein [Enterococcus faecalis]WEB58733.1 collagen-like protein [Enterococcus faecalis]